MTSKNKSFNMSLYHQVVPHTAVFQGDYRDYDSSEQCPISLDNLNENLHIVGTIGKDGYTVGKPFYNLSSLIRWGNSNPINPLTREPLDYFKLETIRWAFPRRDGITQSNYIETDRMLAEARARQILLRNQNRDQQAAAPAEYHPNLYDPDAQQLELEAPFFLPNIFDQIEFRTEMSGMTYILEGPDWLVYYWVHHPYSDYDRENGIPEPNPFFTQIGFAGDENWHDFRLMMARLCTRDNPLVIRYWTVYPLNNDPNNPDSDETTRVLEANQGHLYH